MKKIRFITEYGLILFLSFILGILPRNIVLAIGKILGYMHLALDRRHLKLAINNITMTLCRNGKEEIHPEKIAKGSFLYLSRLLVDILSMQRFIGKWKSEIEWDGIENLESMKGKGYILFSGHFGNWELVAYLQGMMGMPLVMITRPLDNPYLEKWFFNLRYKSGNLVVSKRVAIKESLKAIRENMGVALVTDQNFAGSGKIFSDFLGVPAATSPIIGIVAVRTNCPILPVFSYPNIKGGWNIVYDKPIYYEKTGDRDRDIKAITDLCNKKIGDAISLSPETWFWVHNRWKTRPEDN